MTKNLLLLVTFLISTFFVAIVLPQPAMASVNSFTINRFSADFYLGKDSEGRSTLKTVEEIVATFPQSDQNHGLERAIPLTYDNHPTNLKIESVTNEVGEKLPFETTSSNGNRVIRIGDKDTFVHGKTTYVITYTQRDVTKFFASTERDEFYWDVNGTEWAVPITQLDARIHLSDSLVEASTDKIACYQGLSGSTKACSVQKENRGYSISATNLSPSENITIALGFTPNTFAAYEQTQGEKVWALLLAIWSFLVIVSSIIGVILLVWISVKAYRINNRPNELSPIAPEYLPPSDFSVSVAARILPGARSILTAQLIDLAVRHYVRVNQTKEKTVWKTAEYEIELIKDPSDLQREEIKVLELLFSESQSLEVGARFNMNDLAKNYKLGKAIDETLIRSDIGDKSTYQLRTRHPEQSRWFKRVGYWTLGIGLLILSPVLLITAITAFILGATLAPLTDKGLALRRYLYGLKMYIATAEQDRLALLQSPEGAEKTAGVTEGGDTIQIVRLYERVLPYAILFGQEKKWNQQLGAKYEAANSRPDWYNGQGVFNAAVFTSAMTNFSSATTYATSASSTSGGSGGGGSSGGGGGGGGGGGW